MNNSSIRIVVIIILAGIVLAAAIIFTGGFRSGAPIQLSAIEVRDYQGKPLSSVNNFHENSIKGPQHVNVADYRLTIDGLTNRTMTYTYDDVILHHQSYTKVVTLHCVKGGIQQFSGRASLSVIC